MACAPNKSGRGSPIGTAKSTSPSLSSTYRYGITSSNAAASSGVAANTAVISSSTDKDWFKFTTTSSAPKVKVSLTNLPAVVERTVQFAHAFALARGAIDVWTGQVQDAPSPTYTLVQSYEGARGQLWHVDLYRLKRAEEAFELGLEDAFADAACLIEWPERLEGMLPRDRLDIALDTQGEGRRAMLNGRGKWGARVGSI